MFWDATTIFVLALIILLIASVFLAGLVLGYSAGKRASLSRAASEKVEPFKTSSDTFGGGEPGETGTSGSW